GPPARVPAVGCISTSVGRACRMRPRRLWAFWRSFCCCWFGPLPPLANRPSTPKPPGADPLRPVCLEQRCPLLVRELFERICFQRRAERSPRLFHQVGVFLSAPRCVAPENQAIGAHVTCQCGDVIV